MSKLPIFLYYGEEDFLIEEAVRDLKERYPTRERFSMISNEAVGELTQALALWSSPSLFGEPGLAIVEAQGVLAQPLSPSVCATLLSLLSGVPSQSALLFIGEKLDRENALVCWLKANATIQAYAPIPPWKEETWVRWIEERVRGEGKQISRAEASYLKLLVGPSLRLLAKEIEKLALYLGDRLAVRREDIDALASPGAVHTFAFVDAVREKRTLEALQALRRLLRQGETPFSLFGFLVSQLRPLFQLIRGEEPIRLHPYVLKKNRAAMKQFTLGKLEAWWQEANHLDLLFKTQSVHPSALEALVISLGT